MEPEQQCGAGKEAVYSSFRDKGTGENRVTVSSRCARREFIFCSKEAIQIREEVQERGIWMMKGKGKMFGEEGKGRGRVVFVLGVSGRRDLLIMEGGREGLIAARIKRLWN